MFTVLSTRCLCFTQFDRTQVLTRSTGELQSVDGYMNIALEGTREFVDGKMRRSYGDAFVRGNNGAFSFSLQSSPASAFRSAWRVKLFVVENLLTFVTVTYISADS